MRSAVLFVMVATIAVVHCAPSSLAVSDQTMKLFKLVVCQEMEVGEVPVDKFQLYKLRENIVKQFSKESLERVKKEHCAEGSGAPVKEDFNFDAHCSNLGSLTNPVSQVEPIATTENTLTDATDYTCQPPLLDHVNCDLGCFLIKKHAYNHCVLYKHWQNVMHKLGLSG